MSASIYYQPVRGKCLNVGAPSAFIAAIERAFGSLPGRITVQDLPLLHGLGAGLDSGDARQAVEELKNAVYAHGEIRLWAEY